MTAASLDTLGQQVTSAIGIPKDAWEIAAQLEVLGMRDSDARTGYGVRDLFELARAIERRQRSGAYGFHVEGEDPKPRVIPALRFLRRYLAGIAFALPMALQAAAMLVFGYGIWGALDLELAQGSAIALGFIVSYIAAGGFTQAIVRRGLFYIYQQEEGLARWTALRGLGIGIRTMLALLVPALFLNLVFRILPWSMVLTASVFYAGFVVLWLSWALIYLVRRSELLLIITAVALAAVIGVARTTNVAPIVANGIGVIVAAAVSLATAYLFLDRAAKKRGNVQPVNPPRMAVLVFSTARWFLYGLLFNAFMFADRVIAWTTPVGREDFPPYPFWLEVRYELAMDLALIVIIVMGGFVQYAIERVSEKLVPHEKQTKFADAESFRRDQWRAHRRRSIQLGGMAVLALALAFVVVRAMQQIDNVRLHEALTAPVTMRVLAAAAIGYVFFMFAMRNILLLLTLSRVDAAVNSVAIGLVVNVVTGFICSRGIGYWAAVAGVVAGSVAMSVVAARAARKTLNELDFSYFAAF